MSMSVGKVPGMDGITNEMIQRVWVAIPEYMFYMYNVCMK